MPSEAPSPATIDAWLTGDLSVAEAEAVERYFDKNPMDISSSVAVVMGVALDETVTQADRDPHLNELIKCIQTDHASDMPAPSADAWKELLTPSENADLLGTIGSYEVLEVIATGGMGILLKARDPELERIAAVKVLSPDLATNATARKRFLREARAAAKLEHENILPIYGVHAEAVPYFAMRYVAGGSVQDAIDSGRAFPLEELKSIAKQTAAALSVAHEAGIIHRDIKPANLLLDEDGEKVWVCDFGIALSTEDPSLTYAGNVAGTPQYMSPEQADGHELDGRSDLFSLGSVLYRCATGRQPFDGETSVSVLQNVKATQPAAATQVNSRLPKWFERLLVRLLKKDPGDRFAGAGDVISAIDDERVARPPGENRLPKIALLALVPIAILSVGLMIIKPKPPGPETPPAESAASAFISLQQAIDDAKPGDTIRIPSGEPIPVDGVSIPADKPLILTSINVEERALLTTGEPGVAGITSHSPLQITALDFKINPKPGGDAIVKIVGAELQVDDCTFESRREVQNSYAENKQLAIALIGSGAVRVADSQFDLEHTNAVWIGKTTAPTRVDFSDSEIDAFYAIILHYDCATEHPVEVTADGTSFAGESFLKSSNPTGLPKTNCSAQRSQFTIRRVLFWFQTNDPPPIERNFHWYDRGGNRFTNGEPGIFIGRSSSFRTPLPLVNEAE